MTQKLATTIGQIHEKLKSMPDYANYQNRIKEISDNPYYIPTLSEVREMVKIGWWFSWDYTDEQIIFGLNFVKKFKWFHNFLIEKITWGIMPSYDMPWTFVFKPVTIYIKELYSQNSFDDIKEILLHISNIDKFIFSDSARNMILESFIDGNSLDNEDFRRIIMDYFPEWGVKDHLRNRFIEIYWE